MSNWNLDPAWTDLQDIVANRVSKVVGLTDDMFNSLMENVQYCFKHLNSADIRMGTITTNIIAVGEPATVEVTERVVSGLIYIDFVFNIPSAKNIETVSIGSTGFSFIFEFSDATEKTVEVDTTAVTLVSETAIPTPVTHRLNTLMLASSFNDITNSTIQDGVRSFTSGVAITDTTLAAKLLTATKVYVKCTPSTTTPTNDTIGGIPIDMVADISQGSNIRTGQHMLFLRDDDNNYIVPIAVNVLIMPMENDEAWLAVVAGAGVVTGGSLGQPSGTMPGNIMLLAFEV